MSGQQMPPWLREQLMNMQQAQQNLQSIMVQKQQLDAERMETDRALEELQKASDEDTIYKHAGSVLVRYSRKDIVDELEEKRMLAKTRHDVLEKQEARLKESLKEQEAKLNEAMRGQQAGPDPHQRK